MHQLIWISYLGGQGFSWGTDCPQSMRQFSWHQSDEYDGYSLWLGCRRTVGAGEQLFVSPWASPAPHHSVGTSWALAVGQAWARHQGLSPWHTGRAQQTSLAMFTCDPGRLKGPAVNTSCLPLSAVCIRKTILQPRLQLGSILKMGWLLGFL